VSAHRLSGSRIALAMACGYSARADVPLPPRSESAAASAGTLEHSHIEATLRDGVLDARSPTHAAWLADWYAAHEHEQWAPEMAFAVDPLSGVGVRLDSDGHRDYSRTPPGAIPLTLDAVRVEGGVVHVVDWKTGIQAHTSPASQNAQLHTGALAVAYAYGAHAARVSIVRISPDGVRVDEAELDAIDLADWRSELAGLVRRIPGAEPVPGPHCRAGFCAAYGTTCPATTEALDVVSPEPVRRLPVVVHPDEIRDGEHASYLYDVYRAASARLTALRAALTIYSIEREPIVVGPGVTFGPSTVRRETLSLKSRAAVDALKLELGDAWERAVSVDTSKAGIKLAARAVKAATGETIAAIEARTLDALRAVGAIEVKVSTECKERGTHAAGLALASEEEAA